MAINVRSPHFESITTPNISYGILNLYIWTENKNADVPTNPTYTIRKSATTPATGNPRVTFEISELIKDYLDSTFDGNYVGQGVWVKVDFDCYNSSNVSIIDYEYTILAVDGYTYFEEPYAPNQSIMITNTQSAIETDNENQ